MNVIDKIYYSLQKDTRPSSKVLNALVFLIVGIGGFLLTKDNIYQTLGAIAMFLLGIASFLSVHSFLPRWDIDDENFPNGLRKYIIIIFQLFGIILILLAVLLMILLK